MFRAGFSYSKAKVVLLSLFQSGEYADYLFVTSQSIKSTKVVDVFDQISYRRGKGALRSESIPKKSDWVMLRKFMGQSFTRRIDQPWIVICS